MLATRRVFSGGKNNGLSFRAREMEVCFTDPKAMLGTNSSAFPDKSEQYCANQ